MSFLVPSRVEVPCFDGRIQHQLSRDNPHAPSIRELHRMGWLSAEHKARYDARCTSGAAASKEQEAVGSGGLVCEWTVDVLLSAASRGNMEAEVWVQSAAGERSQAVRISARVRSATSYERWRRQQQGTQFGEFLPKKPAPVGLPSNRPKLVGASGERANAQNRPPPMLLEFPSRTTYSSPRLSEQQATAVTPAATTIAPIVSPRVQHTANRSLTSQPAAASQSSLDYSLSYMYPSTYAAETTAATGGGKQ